jgi:hypothetical protein
MRARASGMSSPGARLIYYEFMYASNSPLGFAARIM